MNGTNQHMNLKLPNSLQKDLSQRKKPQLNAKVHLIVTPISQLKNKMKKQSQAWKQLGITASPTDFEKSIKAKITHQILLILAPSSCCYTNHYTNSKLVCILGN